MDFKKLLDKLQDKVTSPCSVNPSSVIIQQRSLEVKKVSGLSKWRGKLGNVSKPRLFSNNKKDRYTNDKSCSSSIHEPTITLSTPTIFQRPHSSVGHISNIDYTQHRQQRPASCTPTRTVPRRQSRLSVPYVVDNLQSSHYTPYTSMDVYSDDTGSFYNEPLPPPSPRASWHHLSHDTEAHLDYTTVTNYTSSSSTEWVSDDDDPTSNDCYSPVFVGNHVTPSISETLQQHNGDSTSHDGDDHLPAAMPCQEERSHYQLATLNVANTMMMMREQQLEVQMERLRKKNQQLEQQMGDVVNGTWTSTTQLIEENDRLELQIRQLQNQQRRVKPLTGGGESYLQDEQEALRHTRAQLGLVEYLEGEPDVMDALNRFKRLLASSC